MAGVAFHPLVALVRVCLLIKGGWLVFHPLLSLVRVSPLDQGGWLCSPFINCPCVSVSNTKQIGPFRDVMWVKDLVALGSTQWERPKRDPIPFIVHYTLRKKGCYLNVFTGEPFEKPFYGSS